MPVTPAHLLQGNGKHIANVFYISDAGSSSHNVYIRGQASSVNEHRFPLGWSANRDIGCQNVDRDGRDRREYVACKPRPNSALKNKVHGRVASADKVGLFHYVTRSKDDYLAKIGKSVIGLGGSPKKLEYFDLIARWTPRTSELCQLPVQLATSTACCPEAAYVPLADRRQ